MEYEIEHRSSFKRAVGNLSYLTRRLDFLGNMVVMLTIMHGVVAFVAVLFSLTPDGFGLKAFKDAEVRIILLCFDFVLLLVCIVSLAAFEKIGKQGEIYFSEIANEKNWVGEDVDLLRFEYRVYLREFSLSSDLPLARGRSGVSLYVIANGATTFFVWAMLLFVVRVSGYL
mgnify:CR=1 FL=1